jgi:hypothetical protein
VVLNALQQLAQAPVAVSLHIKHDGLQQQQASICTQASAPHAIAHQHPLVTAAMLALQQQELMQKEQSCHAIQKHNKYYTVLKVDAAPSPR